MKESTHKPTYKELEASLKKAERRAQEDFPVDVHTLGGGWLTDVSGSPVCSFFCMSEIIAIFASLQRKV